MSSKVDPNNANEVAKAVHLIFNTSNDEERNFLTLQLEEICK